MRFLLLGGLCLLLSTCQKEKGEEQDPTVFRYSTCGECLNANGDAGYNVYKRDQIVQTKNAECVKFPKMHLVHLLDTAAIIDFNEFGDNELIGFNFKGAQLDSASLFFNKLLDAQLQGAQMTHFQGGYVKITGRIDGCTEIPLAGCSFSSDTISCSW